MKRLVLLLSVFFALAAGARDSRNFDKDWRFILADSAHFSGLSCNDAVWRLLDLPHDWAVEGDFSPSNPSGAGGGALPGGIGWYRKHFTVDKKDKAARFFIAFDGVYMNASVYINGHLLGTRPYGYSSFEYELTPYLKIGADNVIAVKVDNSDQPNSRWYSGCGIYRHVWLTRTDQARIAHWGVKAIPEARDGGFDLPVEVETDNPSGKRLTVSNALLDASGRVVVSGKDKETLRVDNPRLWTLDNPYMYTLRTRLMQGGKTVDEVRTPVGFRTFVFDAEKGFSLNGKAMKINGVCEHHDFGCLGAALHEDAMHRKLTILKRMGVNAIRSSHNPPAPELLNMCDTMGFIVMDESFDMWRRRKTQNDYARFFDEWHERDLTDLVRRDRNHPCIMMWSIGNEVLEQWSSAEADTLTLEQANLILNAGHDASTLAREGELSVNSLLTRHLVEIVHRYDTSRPVTAGCNEPDPNNHLFKSGAIDLIGFNYHRQWIKDVPKNFPGKPFILSESVSALQTRGFYTMPSDSVSMAPKEWWLPYSDPSFMCSAYDNIHAPWSSTHEDTWRIVKHNPFVSGQFIWTGFDYIGEPTPYSYPAHSSYFGIVDLAGFPKDVYYMYQSEWTSTPVLHLFPHWNWIEGDTVDMWCYYNQADEVELFVNGKSQGVRRKQVREKELGQSAPEERLEEEFHVMWRVTFEPGEVKVVARKDGKEAASETIRTAGAPEQIRLKTDYRGDELTFVEADVTDRDGNLCPWADNQIVFQVTDGLRIMGVDNGAQASLERFQSDRRKALHGKALVVLKGKGTLTAKAVDLKKASIGVK